MSTDAGDLTLTGSDDADGDACGSTFTIGVTVSSNADSLTLFVNDNPIEAQSVLQPATEFSVLLGNRGATGNTLRARATMSDGRTCEASFSGQVFVDCPGPSCSLESPLANADGYLNASQDGNIALGLQTSIVVSSELAHAGQVVKLALDSDEDALDDQQLVADGSVALATFDDVTLPDGQHSVQAECRDAFDRITLSPLTVWKVDTTPCTLSIEELANGADPITPADDEDSDPGNGLQVSMTGQITGNECKTLRVGPCAGSDREAIDLLALDLPDDGSFEVHVTLAATTGSLALCANVEDAAGNVGPDQQASVNVRTTSPFLYISSPATGTRFNVAGNGGAVRDDDPDSATCETTILVDCTEEGSDVELLVDDDVVATATCQPLPPPFAGRATFALTSLPTKSDGSLTTLSARQTADGLPVGVAADVTVQTDCEAPSCTLQNANLNEDVLNASLNSNPSDPDDFQNDFTVSTDIDAVGELVRLVIDGNQGASLTASAGPDGGGALASFDGVPLAQGSRSVQAVCTDAAGNARASASKTWTVDSLACDTTLLVAGGADPITIVQDQNLSSDDLQVSATGQTSGGDCTGVRVGLCGSLSGAFIPVGGSQAFSEVRTIPSADGPASLCVEVEDDAGNVSSTEFLRNVRITPPAAAITSPLANAIFNASTGCDDREVVASCSDLGDPVQLFVDSVLIDTQSCVSPGTVTFSVDLATKNDGSSTTLAVQHTADGLVSTLSSIAVKADCDVPLVSISAPDCSSPLALAGDDVNHNPADGLQIDVTVQNGGEPDVTLTVTRGSGPGVISSASGNATSTSFTPVDLGGAGDVQLDACVTDLAGNTGCATSCNLTIVAEPTIAITSPADAATLTGTPDCDLVAAGLQVDVLGTTDAAEGSPVLVTLGAGDPETVNVSALGTFQACVEALDGDDQTLTALVTDSGSSLSGSTSIDVTVDTSVPGTIAPPTCSVTDRRAGTLDVHWLSIADTDGDPLSAYQLRCAAEAIVDDAGWDAATPIAVPQAPALTAGVTETLSLSAFRTGTTRFCVVRGED
ncbi:MAG: hypothetical protein ABW004_07380, partial [Aeromicrobium sp.]